MEIGELKKAFTLHVHRIVKRHYRSRSYIHPHTHDFFHYIYVFNGKGFIQIENEFFRAEKGNLYLVPMHKIHAIFSMEDLINLEFKFICDEPLCFRLNAIDIKCVTLDFYEENLIRDIMNEGILQREFFEYIVHLKLQELLIRILRRESAEGKVIGFDRISWEAKRVMLSGLLEENLHTIIQYIDIHSHEQLSIHQLAKRMGYSLPYFSSQFKQAFGISPSRYILLVRIEKAKELMLYSNSPIERIAREVGFNSIHYFSRVFKTITGLSAREYRSKSKDDIVLNIIPDSSFVPTTKFEHEMLPLPSTWEVPHLSPFEKKLK